MPFIKAGFVVDDRRTTTTSSSILGKRKYRTAINDTEGNVLDEFFFGNNLDGRTMFVGSYQLGAHPVTFQPTAFP